MRAQKLGVIILELFCSTRTRIISVRSAKLRLAVGRNQSISRFGCSTAAVGEGDDEGSLADQSLDFCTYCNNNGSMSAR